MSATRPSEKCKMNTAPRNTTVITAPTKAFVMLDFRETIVCTDGIRKAEQKSFRLVSASVTVIRVAFPSHGEPQGTSVPPVGMR